MADAGLHPARERGAQAMTIALAKHPVRIAEHPVREHPVRNGGVLEVRRSETGRRQRSYMVEGKPALCVGKAFEPPGPYRVTQLLQCLGLDLPYPLPRQLKAMPYFLQGVIIFFTYTEPHADHPFFLRCQG